MTRHHFHNLNTRSQNNKNFLTFHNKNNQLEIREIGLEKVLSLFF